VDIIKILHIVNLSTLISLIFDKIILVILFFSIQENSFQRRETILILKHRLKIIS